ncbi:MAG TPA: serine/threonine-protein kinase, partial [Gemmata sp.]|nr:serine/threonine-protein kinase [Gemmata sp.]
ELLLAGRGDELVVGNYEVLAKLGAGGMGSVYKARHRRMRRIVALKILAPEVAKREAFARRFQREVETLARLTHLNIVMAFDADEAKVGPFLVMEFVNGRDLVSEVTRDGPLPVAEAVDRILQAARGLAYAHSQGIVHRDIKPGNILRDAEGVVKVADLGLARLSELDGSSTNSSLTQAGTVVGTPEFMPPEQAIDSGTVDHRVDIYSLGCTLYFLLHGRPPYQGASIMAVLLKHRDSPIPALVEGRPDVPPELDAIFRRMVAKEPEDRYHTMAEVVRDLEAVRTRIEPSSSAATGEFAAVPATTKQTNETVALSTGAAESGRFELSASVSAPAPTLAGLKILLVEPSRTQAGIIRRYLKDLQLDVVHVTASGVEAIEFARAGGVNLVLTSMHLGDMTGADLARSLFADAACAGIGIVVATSESESGDSVELPANPRLVKMHKPFDSQCLSAALAQAIA